MKFIYPAIFHPEEVGGYSVDFPDLPDCFTQGDSIKECILNGEEALKLVLSDMLREKKQIPTATEIVDAPQGCIVSYISIDIDISKLDKAIKKTVTLPSWLNEEAEKRGINFSKTLQEALITKINMM